MKYVTDPQEIYHLSMAMIKKETDLSRFPEGLRTIVIRLIHACGMCDIVDDLTWSSDIFEAMCRSLREGSMILVDSEMVSAGIIRSCLQERNRIICTLSDPRAFVYSKTAHTTRSAAAVELWKPYLERSIVVIGNAPTALFRLLTLLHEETFRPRAILAFPVGFVGAVEAKQTLIRKNFGVPYLTLQGRRGGSALAASAINGFNEECWS